MIISTLQIHGKTLLKIEGDFLLYSYDHNYIFGRDNIIIKSKDMTLTGGQLEIHINKRTVILSRDCVITIKGRVIEAQYVEFNIDSQALNYYVFAEKISKQSLNPGKENQKGSVTPFSPIPYSRLKKSLLFYIGRRMEIRGNNDVIGFQITIFVEGLQSVSIKRFKRGRSSIVLILYLLY